MNNPFNMSIIRSPVNWIIIFVMLVFALVIAEGLFHLSGRTSCGCHSKES